MVAVLAGGVGAVLSDLAAAAHWGLIRWRLDVVDVTVRMQVRPRPGVRLHRRRLPADETTSHDRIPVTTVARALFDIAAVLDVHRLDRAFNEAEVLGLSGEVSVPELLRRHPRAPGAAKLREVLATGRTARTLSDLEDLFIALVREHHLPVPELNAHIDLPCGPAYVDVLWRDRRLAVELDGGRFHGTARRRQEDRERDRALGKAGFLVMRFSDDDLVGRGQEVVEAVRRSLD